VVRGAAAEGAVRATRRIPALVLVLAAAALAPSRGGAADAAARPTKTLAECIEIALANHPSLGSAEARVEAGRERVNATRAGYLPQLEAGYASTRSDSDLRRVGAGFAGGSFGGSRDGWIHDTGFSLSQLLFDFGRNLDAIRADRAADAATQRETIAFDVKRSYFDLLAAQRLLEVAEETVRNDRQQLELARGRFDVGFAAKIDVTRSEVLLATAELDLITAQNNVAVARDTLRNALGLPGPLDFDVADVLDTLPVALAEDVALETAFAARPELASIEARQRALERDVSARRKDHLPAVTGDARYDWSGDAYPLSPGWSVGASLRWPLFTGGRTMAQVAEAKAELRALRFDTEALRQDVALEVRRALLDLGRAARSIEVTEHAAVQARENLALAEGRYATGAGSIIELTDAQAQRARAEAERVRALYSYQLSIAALERAIGQPVARP
jgi:TolC family type I secretion outer membrane protein